MRQHSPEPDVSYIDANGLRFAYKSWGTTGPLVLMFHGFPDTPHTWDVIAPAIANAGYRVIAPFLRGYSPSATSTRDPDSRLLGEDIVGLIDAFGGPARVVGHDWGAESAYAAAHLAPTRIERLVTIGIPHRATVTITPLLVWKTRHFITLKLPGADRRFAANDYAQARVLCKRWSPTWNPTEADLEPVKNAFAADGCLHAALGYYRALRPNTPAFMKTKIEVPTLCIAGADDPTVTPAVFEQGRSHFAGRYQVTAVPGGHFCHRESPQEALAAVIPFLA